MLSRKRAAEILHEAAALITGDRARHYGEPQQNFENIAAHWSTYLRREITVYDVSIMMILLKVSRASTGEHHKDNFTDICGYAALQGSDGTAEMFEEFNKDNPLESTNVKNYTPPDNIQDINDGRSIGQHLEEAEKYKLNRRPDKY